MEFILGIIGFFGWKWLVVIALIYLGMYVGAHNPQWRILHASQNGMEKTAAKLLGKVKKFALKEAVKGDG